MKKTNDYIITPPQ